MKRRWWLLLEKSAETRTSKGIDPYNDQTGRIYRYDSKVPNHRQLQSGAGVVLRKENRIIGTGLIEQIVVSDAMKTHRRCPSCRGTDVRERKTRVPRWRCGRCSNEFTVPEETQSPVKSYVASIANFQSLDSPPTVGQIKATSVAEDGERSQLSIMELDPDLLGKIVGDEVLASSVQQRDEQCSGGQGYGLTSAQRRAVELRSMAVASEIYSNEGWSLQDTSANKPFDFLATREGERRFIEVKGTTGKGDTIILTGGEVGHARRHHREMALVVVAEVSLQNVDGVWSGKGGKVVVHLHPWSPEAGRLTATEYRYDVPT